MKKLIDIAFKVVVVLWLISLSVATTASNRELQTQIVDLTSATKSNTEAIEHHNKTLQYQMDMIKTLAGIKPRS